MDGGGGPRGPRELRDEASNEVAKQVGMKIFKYCDQKDKILMILGGLCAFISGAGMPAFSQIIGIVVSDMTSSSGDDLKEKMSRIAWITVVVGVCLAVPQSIAAYSINYSTMRQVTRIKLLYFKALMRQEVGWHDANPPGELTSRMDGDTKVIEEAMGTNFQQLLQHIGTFFFAYGIAFYNAWELTLIMLCVIPFIGGNAIFFGSRIKKASIATRDAYATAGGLALEAIDNIKTVQVFGREEYESKRFSDAVVPAVACGIRKEVSTFMASGINNLFLYISMGYSFWFGAYLIWWGRVEMSDVVTVFMCGIMSCFSITRLSPCVSVFFEGAGAAAKIFGVIDRVPEMDCVTLPEDVKNGVTAQDKKSSIYENIPESANILLPSGRLEKEITFKNVAFAYPTRKNDQLFTNLNMSIKKGQTVAFSGASGCGKSSIIGLVQRFYDPVKGQVLVDGVDMKDLNLRGWRDCIAIVSQEPKLFTGTVMENVKIARPNATDEEVIEACKRAHVHKVIEKLPQQYETLVGTGGSQLSGGQKQRVAIARALICKPQILILDEATSALDRKSEIEVQAALEDVMFGRGVEDAEPLTVIVIAHRLATIQNANVIHFVNHDDVQGSWIEESGTFAELMEMDGHFAAMTKKQGSAPAEGDVTKEDDDADDDPNTGGAENASVFDRQESTVSVSRQKTTDGTLQRGGSTMILDDEDEALYADLNENRLEDVDKAGVLATGTNHARVLQLAAGDRWYILLGLIGCIIAGGEYPCYGIFYSQLINALGKLAVTHDESILKDKIPIWCCAMFCIAIGSFTAYSMMCGFAFSGERLTLKLRRVVFYSILRQDMTFFDTPGRDSSSLASILSSDTEVVHGLWGPSIGTNLRIVTTMVIGLVVALVYAWRVALVVLATIPCFMIVIVGAAMILKFINVTDDSPIKAEALTNIRTVVSLNLQDIMIGRYSAHVAELEARQSKNAIIKGIQGGLMGIVMFGLMALIIWYQGHLIADGTNTFLEVMTAQQAVMQGLRGIMDATTVSSKFADCSNAAKRVFYIIDRVPKIEAAPKADLMSVAENSIHAENANARPASNSNDREAELSNITGSPLEANPFSGLDAVTLKDVRFRYPSRPEMPLLRGVDLKFTMPQTYGLMGETGCGKSTLVGLITRLYDPAAGSVSVRVVGAPSTPAIAKEPTNTVSFDEKGRAQVDLKEVDLVDWRANISLVLQEPSLFSGTIRENIRYSKPDATDEEIEEAAKHASLHDDVMMMPLRYETNVGYKGGQLSGGQKQRVAIARALVRKPKMLLMDEATSALDNATEGRVEEGIRRASAANKMIVIAVAHRLTTIRDSNKIAVMEAGRVKEFGSHEELIALGGHYKDRWQLFEATGQKQQSQTL